jgi:hypothetical protein
MIVNRRTFSVKPGQVEAIIEVLSTGADHIADRPVLRLYEAYMGVANRVAFELEFDDLAHYARFWDEWTAAPESAQVLEKFNQHLEMEWTNEIWRVR